MSSSRHTPHCNLPHFLLLSPLTDEWSFAPLIVLVVVYHLMATCTYGVMASSGIFIPSLLIGGVWGRLVGMLLMQWLPGIVSTVSVVVVAVVVVWWRRWRWRWR